MSLIAHSTLLSHWWINNHYINVTSLILRFLLKRWHRPQTVIRSTTRVLTWADGFRSRGVSVNGPQHCLVKVVSFLFHLDKYRLVLLFVWDINIIMCMCPVWTWDSCRWRCLNVCTGMLFHKHQHVCMCTARCLWFASDIFTYNAVLGPGHNLTWWCDMTVI